MLLRSMVMIFRFSFFLDIIPCDSFGLIAEWYLGLCFLKNFLKKKKNMIWVDSQIED